MCDDIIQSLLNKAKNMNVDVVWDNHFSSYTPPASSTKYNRIVMNTNWHKSNEFIFQLAHELAHIITMMIVKWRFTTLLTHHKNVLNVKLTTEQLNCFYQYLKIWDMKTTLLNLCKCFMFQITYLIMLLKL